MAWPRRFRSSRSTIGSSRSDDLHDHLGPEPRQPGDEIGERHVAADDDMVGEGEAEDEVRSAPVHQRAALQAPPSEARRRVGNVRHERQDRRPVLRLEAVVQAVDHQVIGVERQHVVGVIGRHPGVDAAGGLAGRAGWRPHSLSFSNSEHFLDTTNPVWGCLRDGARSYAISPWKKSVR